MSEHSAVVVRRRLRLRALSAVVLLVVAAIAVAGCLVTRQVVHDQERKLLKQRTEEAGLYVSSVLTAAVQSPLATLASAAASGGVAEFKTNAAVAALVFPTVALVSTTGSPQVVAAAGKTTLTDVGGVRGAAIDKAASAAQATGTFVATPVFRSGSGSVIGFAYSTPALKGDVVYAEAPVHPQTQTPATSGQPFSELVAAIYAAPRVRSNDLLLSSVPLKDVPLRGNTARVTVKVGDGQPWLLVTKARRPLVGSVATATPWAILGAGLLAALLATAVVETLARRREYAVNLAETRTEELKRSLSDLAAAHQQLVRQERLAAIGQLASTIGHELRNPLGVLNNAVYLLRTDLGSTPTPAAQRHLATAEREIAAATVIVSDLLEFARQRDPVPDDVDVVALVDEVLSVLPPPTGISVGRDGPAGPVVIRADRDMLRQVLLNLVGNAYQAMPDGGRVTVDLAAQDGAVRLAVRDTGTGISDEAREHLFEPFFTTKARGIGLGLVVSRRIVEAHGGDLSVTSAAGQGSEFVVTLPVIAQPRAAAEQEPAVAETSQ